MVRTKDRGIEMVVSSLASSVDRDKDLFHKDGNDSGLGLGLYFGAKISMIDVGSSKG